MRLGYSNPIRGMERKMAPDFAMREFRNPGLRSGLGSTGLGSLHHTMPHLARRVAGPRLQSGGLNPVGQAYSAARPNLYNPDPMHRRVMEALRQIGPANRNLNTPFAGFEFPYAAGGAAPGEVMEPEEDQSPAGGQQREIVLEAMAALEGESSDPMEALAQFIDAFGPRALADLQQMVESKHREEQDGTGEEGEEDGETDTEPKTNAGVNLEEEGTEAAGGGFLRGGGTGQSDEIEGVTPTGRPVLLSDGEYVIDAPTVAALGDGSSNAGARRLDELRRQIRQNAYGHEKQAKPMAKGGSSLVFKLG